MDNKLLKVLKYIEYDWYSDFKAYITTTDIYKYNDNNLIIGIDVDTLKTELLLILDNHIPMMINDFLLERDYNTVRLYSDWADRLYKTYLSL